MDQAKVRTAVNGQDTRPAVIGRCAKPAGQSEHKKRAVTALPSTRDSAAKSACQCDHKKRAVAALPSTRDTMSEIRGIIYSASASMDQAKVRTADDGQDTRPAVIGRAAQPAGQSDDKKRAATALPSTRDTMLEIKGMIYSASAGDYRSWRKAHPDEPRRSAGSLVGNLQLAIQEKCHCSTGSAETSGKSDEPRVPFAVLIGWLVEKMCAHGTDLEDGKELLWDMVQREHQLFRYMEILRKANEMEDCGSEERSIDKQVLNEILPLVQEASENAKRTLRLAVGMHGDIQVSPVSMQC